jgi:DNA-binding NtrC family response regulator
MALLMKYSWPGNVRELRTAVEHGVVLSQENMIEPNDLPSAIQRDQGAVPFSKGVKLPKLEDVERSAIEAALEKSRENITEAAKALGISRRTLHRKLAESPRKGRVK